MIPDTLPVAEYEVSQADTDYANLYSPHAEEALVGAAIINPGVLDEVDVAPEEFWLKRLGMIWGAILSIRARGEFPDFVNLGAELDTRGELLEVGGPAYLARLIGETISSSHADSYARIVKDKAARRKMLALAQDLSLAATTKDSDLDAAIGKHMTELIQTGSNRRGATHWSKAIGKAYDFVEQRQANPGGVWGIRTGFDDFDFQTGGLQESELLLLTGESGVGKSMFMLQMARQMADPKIGDAPGAIYSLEMLDTSLGLRALSAETKIKSKSLKSGTVQDDEWTTFIAAVETLEALPVYLSDDSNWTTTAIRSDLARLKRQNGIRWFMVDYSYLVADGVGVLNETDRTQIIISAMKGITKSLNLAGVVIHSLNKAGELRGSGQVKYDADIILSLTVPDDLNPHIILCDFTKGRELDGLKSFNLVRLPGLPKYGRLEAHRSPMAP